MWNFYGLIFASTLWFLSFANAQDPGDTGCLPGSYRHGSYCYGVWPIHTSYENAENFCKMSGGLLAPIRDKETQNFIHKLYIRKFLQNYWFGLTDKKTEGQWIYSDNTPLSGFAKWLPGEPTNSGNNENCATLWMLWNLRWNDVDCTLKRVYICEYGGEYSTDKCREQFCYELSKDFVTYDEADKICKQKGGRLATIKTEETFNFLKDHIYADRSWLNLTEEQMRPMFQDSKYVHWTAWIGTRFLNGNWINSDGTPTVFTNWAPGNPQNDYNQEGCVALAPFWINSNCVNSHAFICQYPVKEHSECPLPDPHHCEEGSAESMIIKGSYTAEISFKNANNYV